MGIVLKESERLDALITDFLLFAFPHAGDRESIPLRDMVEETLELFRKGPHFQEGLSVDVRMDPAVRINGNRRQLQQILWNLLLNAAQSMSEGGEIRVEAEQTRSRAGVPSVVWRVVDTGRGIAAENLTRIFDPFYTTKEPGKGTGLGLSVCYRIVEGMGGAIRAESKSGEGATIIVSLPLYEGQIPRGEG